MLGLLRFALAFAAFLLPGYGVVAFVHRRHRPWWPAHWALAFAWSIALVGAVGWPFLWYQKSFDSFLRVAECVWLVYGALGAAAFVLSARSRSAFRLDNKNDDEGDEETGAPVTPRFPLPPPRRAPTPWHPRLAGELAPVLLTAIGAYLAGCATLLAGWSLHFNPVFFFIAIPILLYCGARLARALLGRIDLRRVPVDHGAAPRAFQIAALAFLAAQVIATTVYDRPDWDDCMFLSAVTDYEHAQVLNHEEPSHREGLPMPTAHRTLVWELWGAAMVRLSGLSSMVLFHTVLPPILVLLAYAGYATLLREWVPRAWLPLALIGLSAFHLWGISGHEAAANFLLPRPWQGKSVLLHLAIPLVALLLLRVGRHRSGGDIASLVAAVGFGLTVSLSAIFLLAPLIAGLTFALLWADWPERRAPGHRRGAVLLVVGAVVATAPLVLAALALRNPMRSELALQGHPAGVDWVIAIYGATHDGVAELIWLLALPWLYVLVKDRRRRAYLVFFPVVLFATVLNPAFFQVLVTHVTSYYTYVRFLWLLPVGVGLGTLLALGLRAVALRVPPASPREPLGIALVVVAACFGLQGLYVFGPNNNIIGPLGTPHLADNPEKMPAALKPLAALLLADPELDRVRILCDEQIASFLAPLSSRVRLVQSRPIYTPMMFASAGHPFEGLERFLLATTTVSGRRLDGTSLAANLEQLDGVYGTDHVARVFGVAIPRLGADNRRALMDKYHVRWAVTGPGNHGDEVLRTAGFTRMDERGPFQLWRSTATAAPRTISQPLD